MRNMNCQNVRREIEEAGSGELPSAAASAHLESCAACETLFREQSKLQAIMSSLGTVAAPGDFDFRLRARLAGERRGTRPAGLLDFSLGFRSAAVALVLLLVGASVWFVGFRTRSDNASGNAPQIASQPAAPTSVSNPVPGSAVEKASAPQVAVVSGESETGAVAPRTASSDQGTPRRVIRPELAIAKGASRVGTRDMSSTPAAVFGRDNELGTYPTAPFPINASNQSLKVSVDDGSGGSRTISLPTVSFGSQRALSQSTTPLMASARVVW